MARNSAAKAVNTSRPSSPLFPHSGDPEEKRVYADEITVIDVYRLLPTPHRPARKVLVSENEFTDEETGEVLEIIPATTREADLQRFFGGGEYFLQALDADNNFLTGRTVFLGGPPRNEYLKKRAKKYGLEKDDEEEEERAPEPPAVDPLIEYMRESNAESKEYAMNTMKMFMGMQGLNAQKSDGSVDLLRSQLDQSLRDHRNEMDRRQKEIDDMRDRNREDLRRRDQQYDDLRKKTDDEIAEMKRRHNADIDESKKRHERDLQYEYDRAKRREKELEAEIEAMKRKTAELEKETIGLHKDLASIPDAPEQLKSEPAPWYAALGVQAVKAMADVVQQRNANAAANPPTPQLPVQQHVPVVQAPPIVQEPVIAANPPPIPPTPIQTARPMVFERVSTDFGEELATEHEPDDVIDSHD